MFALSTCPIRLATAPVNAPFSCPNSSLSTRFSGIAAQFKVINGLLFLSLNETIAFAYCAPWNNILSPPRVLTAILLMPLPGKRYPATVPKNADNSPLQPPL